MVITADISLMRSDVCRAGEAMRGYEYERERERGRGGGGYSIHIRRKLLCCHKPFSGKHSELVCVAGGGYNCPDMGIVSMDRASEDGERKKVGGSDGGL